MKQNNLFYILIVSITILLISCGEDFLYKAPQGSIDQDALKSQTGIDLLTVTAYANLTENGWGASPFNWTFGGMYGGDANKGSDTNDQSVLNEMEKYDVASTNGYLGDKWNWIYKGVKRVNIALQTMAMVEDLPEAFQSKRNGELHFLRALFYFEGIKVFGPYIPWIDETITDNDPKVHNDIDIYPKVLEDIDIAIRDLPNTQDASGRANIWAAKALKTKILMQKGDLAAAKPILKDIIDNGQTSNGAKYALEDDMNANFDSYRDNGKESIFAVQFSAESGNANSGMSLCYPYGGATEPGGCCGFYQPSYELANSFKVGEDGLPLLDNSYRNAPFVDMKYVPAEGEQNAPLSKNNNDVAVDPRIDFAIGRYGIPYKDWGLPKNSWVRDVNNGGYYVPKKHVYTKRELDAGLANGGFHDGWAPGSAMNLQYLSLRDIILLYAECLANDDDLSGAMELVNQIRARAALDVNIIKNNGKPAANYKIANYPPSHAAFSDKETCIKAVRMERKLELAMEGQRWFDLVRWGGEEMAKAISDYVEFEKAHINKFAFSNKLPASKTMFPLPQEQVQTMGNDENGKPYLLQPEPWR
ncbi:RagB/SusD family nutrient uptake outer membrane protein [Proteiniphilum sp. X52]|uniref:RagB/SusD family nutrient uptake outer membrane protein n=1 Tax=Proteiniphilum sp. X52 TaxID=2382159 RepID=UPI000F0A76B6|nr:RagB/SusD family nutrient uptake outer membrane protein [Proteiniphilum sp. X52]RNC64594.1 RagB/SusD family nutrient uptake outer membrane protein [Proteiniphilum sp. X52]